MGREMKAGRDGAQGVFGDTATVVSGAVGAALRDGTGQRILHGVSRGFEDDGDAVLIRLRDAGAVAARAGGKAEVFQRAAEADVKLAVVGIDDGQGRAEIGTEGDLSVADGESPRLGIVTGGCFACLFEDVQVIGIESIHEVLLLRVSPMVSVLPGIPDGGYGGHHAFMFLCHECDVCCGMRKFIVYKRLL